MRSTAFLLLAFLLPVLLPAGAAQHESYVTYGSASGIPFRLSVEGSDLRLVFCDIFSALAESEWREPIVAVHSTLTGITFETEGSSYSVTSVTGGYAATGNVGLLAYVGASHADTTPC